MCGRISLTLSPADLEREFGIVQLPADYRPRYNIAPSQDILTVVGAGGAERRPDAAANAAANAAEPTLATLPARWAMLRWGLVPFWAKDPSIGNRMINARSESVAGKPAFRAAFSRRRCLIITDGFYEWRKERGGPKTPMRIRLRSGRPFALAGIWEEWRPGHGRDGDGDGGNAGGQKPDDDVLRTCAILTTPCSDFMRPIHDRMPVILPAGERALWLDVSLDPQHALSLLRPYEGEDLEAYAVSTIVNSPRNDVPDCIVPAPDPGSPPEPDSPPELPL